MSTTGLTREKEWADKLRHCVDEYNSLTSKLENAGYKVVTFARQEGHITFPDITKEYTIKL